MKLMRVPWIKITGLVLLFVFLAGVHLYAGQAAGGACPNGGFATINVSVDPSDTSNYTGTAMTGNLIISGTINNQPVSMTVPISKKLDGSGGMAINGISAQAVLCGSFQLKFELNIVGTYTNPNTKKKTQIAITGTTTSGINFGPTNMTSNVTMNSLTVTTK
jgi:hypothetical protein